MDKIEMISSNMMLKYSDKILNSFSPRKLSRIDDSPKSDEKVKLKLKK